MTDPLLTDTEAVALVTALRDSGTTVATAESLTAGLLSATIAGVSGASAVLRGGLVVYATELKHELAAVPATVLASHGPVSAETAAALARGARVRCGADWGVGLTGVAGPGSQDGRPPGLVFCGVAHDERVHIERWQLKGDRWGIRSGAVRAAISALLAQLGTNPPPSAL